MEKKFEKGTVGLKKIFLTQVDECTDASRQPLSPRGTELLRQPTSPRDVFFKDAGVYEDELSKSAKPDTPDKPNTPR